MLHLDDGRCSGTAGTFSKEVGRLLNTFKNNQFRNKLASLEAMLVRNSADRLTYAQG